MTIVTWPAGMVVLSGFRQYAEHSVDLEHGDPLGLVSDQSEQPGADAEVGPRRKQTVHRLRGREGALLEGRGHFGVLLPDGKQEIQHPKVHLEQRPQKNTPLRQSRTHLRRPRLLMILHCLLAKH